MYFRLQLEPSKKGIGKIKGLIHSFKGKERKMSMG